MALLAPVNRDTLILQNIISVISTAKLSTQANKSLSIPYAPPGCGDDWSGMSAAVWAVFTASEWEIFGSAGPTCGVQYFTDAARTIQAFEDSSDTSPSSFVEPGNGTTLYTPADSLINSGPYAFSPLYYTTATFCDATVKYGTYSNLQNLVFQSVIVSSKPNPQFSINANSCIIVPADNELEDRGNNEDRSYVILTFSLFLQLNVFNWDGLSELARIQQKQLVGNILRNALYADRYRGGNATLRDKNLNGTFVGDIELLPSKGVLKARVCVKCVYNVASTGF